MVNDATNPRQQRGLEIAATTHIVRKGKEWMVRSQTLKGRYRVTKGPHGFRCTCPDFELRGQTCKHGYAVDFVLQRKTQPDGTVIETGVARVTYPQDWSAYNRAQVTEKEQFCVLLRDLVSDVPEPFQRRGRPPLPQTDMMFAAGYKVYSTLSARRFMTDLRTAQTLGYVSRVPHYNSIFNFMDTDALTPMLHTLITRSAYPLKGLETQFAVDSTGFGVQSFYRHYTAKYGHDQISRDYMKLHAMIGTRTNVITAAIVTDRDSHDSPHLPALAAATSLNFDVQQLSADKGYSSHENIQVINKLGVEPLVAFTKNAKGNSGVPLWDKLFHSFQMHRDEFLAKYHRRSNVESTFSSMKRTLGETLRSKTVTSRTNELLLKVVCHNLVCLIHEIEESGARADFPVLGTSGKVIGRRRLVAPSSLN